MDYVIEGWNQFLRIMNAQLFMLGETPVNTAGIVRLIAILVAAWWIARLAGKGLERLGSRNKSFSPSSVYALSKILRYFILVVAVVIGLNSIGFSFASLAIFAGALGLGVGIGLQGLFSNFVSGIIILVERSLKVGDFVELESGITGEVLAINTRSTLIATNDNVDIVVPNSEFVNTRMINWTLREADRRIHVPFGVAYGSDKDLVKKAVLEAAESVPHTLINDRRKPGVWLVEFGDRGLNFELVVWLNPPAVKRPGAVQADYLWAIETALRKYGIAIPFPQRDLHVRSVLGSADAAALGALASRSGDGAPPKPPRDEGEDAV